MVSAAAIGIADWALRHLGRQWRIQAVITDDHRLVTTGPYALVRHPVYLAFLAMLVATVLVRASAAAGAVSVLLFVAGTEIRIAAEDGILAEAFPSEFPGYRRRVAAWLPGVR
jgi:protein-S-isoprenylcysteine O-methyltransferase Ste14